ncbi:hypothetical protein [Streptomyces capitiformicae]|uniref:Uncharacterized protein n=1 Tax=Streptomyces capitiformicae TaxID=2014920 RepID=A0A919GD80_9ACTN|nr:hypothetical protein [Streptomyces capitiformicae]GHH82324.1 hypothetical protein GCM10017771_06170 [Streptomyces capitiformicae]
MSHDDEFGRALETVLRDLRAQCAVRPAIREPEDDYPGVLLSGWGVYAEPDGRPAVLLSDVADQVQGWAVEALWEAGLSAVWPQCPEHPDTHPLRATVEKSAAVWVCPRTGVAVSRVGELLSRGGGE